MSAAKKYPLYAVKVRPGRRWPRRPLSVHDDRLLGAQWVWDDAVDEVEPDNEPDDEPDEPPTRLRYAADLYLA